MINFIQKCVFIVLGKFEITFLYDSRVEPVRKMFSAVEKKRKSALYRATATRRALYYYPRYCLKQHLEYNSKRACTRRAMEKSWLVRSRVGINTSALRAGMQDRTWRVFHGKPRRPAARCTASRCCLKYAGILTQFYGSALGLFA